jgi:hypothetical protein
VEQFARLINTDAWLRSKDKNNRNQLPIHKAVHGGNVDVVRFIATKFPETIVAADDVSYTHSRFTILFWTSLAKTITI